jgi:hypothetical protein
MVAALHELAVAAAVVGALVIVLFFIGLFLGPRE